MEKAMAPHSSTPAWKIPWMEEPGRLQSMGSLWVGYDWAISLSLFTFMHWRRKWQPTPVFLPGESQGWGSLVGCLLWGGTELDTTEVTWQQAAGKVGAKCEAQESGILGAKWESVPIRCCDRSSKMGPEKWSLDNFLGSWINLLGFRNLLFWLFHTWWSL